MMRGRFVSDREGLLWDEFSIEARRTVPTLGMIADCHSTCQGPGAVAGGGAWAGWLRATLGHRCGIARRSRLADLAPEPPLLDGRLATHHLVDALVVLGHSPPGESGLDVGAAGLAVERRDAIAGEHHLLDRVADEPRY